MIERFDKQRAIVKIMKRAVSRMNADDHLKQDANNFGECSIGIVIKDFFGRLGDFNGSYIDGNFNIRRSLDNEKFDAIVVVTEDAFMNLYKGTINPEYALGTGGITVTGRHAYKMMVVGLGVGELLYDLMNDK